MTAAPGAGQLSKAPASLSFLQKNCLRQPPSLLTGLSCPGRRPGSESHGAPHEASWFLSLRPQSAIRTEPLNGGRSQSSLHEAYMNSRTKRPSGSRRSSRK